MEITIEDVFKWLDNAVLDREAEELLEEDGEAILEAISEYQRSCDENFHSLPPETQFRERAKAQVAFDRFNAEVVSRYAEVREDLDNEVLRCRSQYRCLPEHESAIDIVTSVMRQKALERLWGSYEKNVG